MIMSRFAKLLALVVVGASCGSGGTPAANQPPAPQPVATPPVAQPPVATPVGPAPTPAPDAQPVAQTPPAPAPPGPLDPVRERARQLREAADSLDKAADARERGARSYAEQLFSGAELVTGAEALASIAPGFREGAPPRVTTPTKKVTDTAPQPVAVGDSEKDRPEPKPKKGAVAGTLTRDGSPLANGELGVVTLSPMGRNNRRGRVAFPTARVIEQRNRQFAPRVLVLPVGSIVSFPNFDPLFHNVFSTSEAKPFDLGLYKSGETREIFFEKEGTVRVGCNLHANMSAFVVVASAPHYTITDASGKFSFKSVEPGRYVLRAYSERSLAPIVEEIEVKSGRNEIAVGVKADAPAGPLPDKFGVARAAKKP